MWGPNVKCEGPFGHELSPKQRKWALSSRQVGVVRAQLGRAGSAMEAMWGPFWVSTETHWLRSSAFHNVATTSIGQVGWGGVRWGRGLYALDNATSDAAPLQPTLAAATMVRCSSTFGNAPPLRSHEPARAVDAQWHARTVARARACARAHTCARRNDPHSRPHSLRSCSYAAPLSRASAAPRLSAVISFLSQ